MNEQELREHRRGFMVRLVGMMDSLGEQLLGDYKRWVSGLSAVEFDEYLERYRSLGELVWGLPPGREETRGRQMAFVMVEQYPLSEAPYRDLLRLRRNEASIYCALALWKADEARRVERAGPEAFKSGRG